MSVESGDPQLHRQFQTVEELLTRWLEERRALLSRYTVLAERLNSDLENTSCSRCQSDLCEVLVDYISAGHFEVFHQLVNEAEAFADGSETLAARLMPAIVDTTEVMLAYDEKYSGEQSDETHLKRDLSALGEMLESRFVLEDRLIAGLHNRHRVVAESS